MHSPILTIARKDTIDATRDRFLQTVTAFLVVAVVVSIVAGAIALASDVATYAAARDQLLALGKPASAIAAPEFYPLKLLRGAIEQIEIMGAVTALLAGYRAAAAERGRQMLALILTRPLRHWQFLAAKLLGGIGLAALSLLAVFVAATFLLAVLAGVGLSGDDLARVAITWAVASVYVAGFYTLSFGLCLWARQPANGLLYGFAIWLLIVLIAPQIGDTLDPDNQVAGGVFAHLSVPKAEQDRIKAGYAGYEALRNGIEVASVTKHLERFSFAVLGIKDTYTGTPLATVLSEKRGDALWILLFTLGLGGLVLLRPISPDRLTKE